ncbi:ABC transporter permease [Bosea sp. 2KB_26]|uniref:ABC transporter permease n=1 Tax=Bosea sp. 2KB_26 TaxID=3237475 RepID=UPI003F9317A2
MAAMAAEPKLSGASHFARADRREAMSFALLALPGIVIVGLLLIVPVGWLFVLSFIGKDGGISLENYMRMTQPVYVITFVTTFQIASIVTLGCILLGYPVAYLLSQLSPRTAAICMIFVILPFWTSVLVRTYAWLVLLQRRGLVNSWLVGLGIVSEPIPLVNNFTGTVIGMLHVLLPFMILPLYSSMKTIDSDYMKAAASSGASPMRAFWDVFFPLSRPGLFAGTVLVFILSLGFYLTPALLGGGRVSMWSMQIGTNVSTYSNWGAASALGVLLLVVTIAILVLLNKVFRVDKLYGGR